MAGVLLYFHEYNDLQTASVDLHLLTRNTCRIHTLEV
jgi:hypothetical protein